MDGPTGPDQTTGVTPSTKASISTPEQQAVPNKVDLGETMRNLWEKNKQLGGNLFAIFGRRNMGETDIRKSLYIFPTPISASMGAGEETTNMAEFLMVAQDGFMLLQVAEGARMSDGVTTVKQNIVDVTNSRLPEFKGRSGEWLMRGDEGLFRESPQAERGISGLIINTDQGGPGIFINTASGKSSVLGEDTTGLIRLATNIKADQVTKIFRANIERVERDRKEYEEKIKPHIEAAQQIDQMLGESPA